MPKESRDETKKRARKIVGLLKKHYPDSKCTLDFKTTHQLMVATILSAQCTDERVNKVTPALFKKYKSVKSFAAADLRELEKDIYSTGFYSNKAKAIKNSAVELMREFDGRIPKKLDELVKLPGIGRKTGSVILGAGCGLAEGIVVDTHVGRISRLLGWTSQKDAVKIERDLMAIIPKKDWIGLSHMLIDHGRAVCIARRPKCADCCLKKLCPSSQA
jgi:endonuclease-3